MRQAHQRCPCLPVMPVGEKANLQRFIRCFLPQEQHAVCPGSRYLA
ncbi:hypothetical protein NT01EI_1018 [Edwardsiella ictaluri 93-146]|uniref:Uncharacterized protein n=1 Tax=Edwardsiella ictaluri (strain 93-146) TaxID=634503 RepID=C5BBJ9_EDWI9|nr:hypothetical protein NT01EI_1018 [Edwardsiella ictaluri 93-146]